MKSSEQPIFRQIIERINAGIDSGEFARGQTIPSEPDLSRQFQTTRMTVRRAIDALVSEGKLFRVQGKGTFVSQMELNRTYQKLGLTSHVLSLGMHPSSKVIYAGECNTAPQIRAHLNLEPDEPLFCLKRIRYADLEPIAVEMTWLSLRRFDRLAQFDFEQESLYEVLHRDFGLDLSTSYSQRRINAMTISGEDAQALFGKKRGVALRIRSVDYDKTHRPFAASEVYYHSAKYTLEFVV